MKYDEGFFVERTFEMLQRVQVGLFVVVVGGCFGLLLGACAESEEKSSNSEQKVEASGDLGAVATEQPVPAGPIDSDEIDKTVQAAESELAVLEMLEPTNSLIQAEVRVDFQKGTVDSRSSDDGSVLEVVANSDDGTYIVGKSERNLLSRISLMCGPDDPANLLVVDTKGRADLEWVVIVDRLVPTIVATSGCELALLTSPTDCLGLPDDPAACIPGDGVEE